MIKLSPIDIKIGIESTKKLGHDVSEKHLTPTIAEISQTASDCISNLQLGSIEAKKNLSKLNKHSLACAYFGVDSANHIQKQIGNQLALSWLKITEQNLENFPPIVLHDTPKMKRINKSINNLKEKKYGRLTITDKSFEINGEGGTHTVGIVYHKDKFYVLDSIPETYPGIKNCHDRLIKILGLNREGIIISKKPQQNIEEYTCNNWTHANIDAVKEYIENNGQDKELTPKTLNKILPEDINTVLDRQFVYISDKLKGRDLSEVAEEHYEKTHKFSGF